MEPKGKILAIEDDDLSRLLLKTQCSMFGYEIQTATNGRRGIEEYFRALNDNTPFDIVILDYRLPDMNGEEIYSALNEIKKVPAILYSANSFPKGLNGFDVCLQKPVNMKDLEKALSTILSK